MKIKDLLKLAAILCCTVFSLCVFAEEDDDAEEEIAESVDIRPVLCVDEEYIENKSDNKRANFSALVDRLIHEIVSIDIYQVTDAKSAVEIFNRKDKEWVLFDTPPEPGKPLHRGAFIKLQVGTYGVFSEFDRFTNTEKKVAKIELIMRIEDRNGKVLESINLPASHASSAVSRNSRSNIDEQLLQAATADAVKRAARALIEFEKFAVLDVDAESGLVMIEAPATVVKVGDILKVRKAGKAIKTRKDMTRNFPKIGFAQVVEVDKSYSNVRMIAITEQNATVKAGNFVQFASEQELQQIMPPQRGGRGPY